MECPAIPVALDFQDIQERTPEQVATPDIQENRAIQEFPGSRATQARAGSRGIQDGRHIQGIRALRPQAIVGIQEQAVSVVIQEGQGSVDIPAQT